ncbi:MAG: efflux RND transporter periplasmic adaptor subunit [Bryobacteraceae bacterium]|nr:efflux RND transporter periplasmic adaptor subunit [Bryobacteraceae bacterium]
MKKLLLVLLLAASGGITWLIWKRSQPPEVPVVRVRRETIVSAIQTNGRIEPLQRIAARAERPGIIAKLNVEQGQRVAAGAVIAELTADDTQADLAAANARIAEAQAAIESLRRGGRESDLVAIEASLTEAKSQLEAARAERDALRRLADKQAATGEEVRAAERAVQKWEIEIESLEKRRAAIVSAADVKAAEARLRQAQAEAAQARRGVSRQTVRAGIGGVVYNLETRLGAFVEQGGLIAEIGQLEKVRVVIHVDEPDLGRVAVGMPVVITWDALPGREWRGEVERGATSIVRLGARQVGEVAGIIDNPESQLVPDANVNVEIRSRIAENTLALPKEALHGVGDQIGVYVLAGERLEWRLVKVGVSDITRSEILSGLKEGDAVALGAVEQFADGMRVRARTP